MSLLTTHLEGKTKEGRPAMDCSEVYIVVAPNPCGEGYIATKITPETAQTIASILSSCWLIRHYRGVEVTYGDTPQEAVTNFLQQQHQTKAA